MSRKLGREAKQDRETSSSTAAIASTGQYFANVKSSRLSTLHAAAMPPSNAIVPATRATSVPSLRSSR